MSGHNKWSKIKHKKAAEDSKKSREFSKFSHLITLEARRAEGNSESPALRKAVERARSINMPLLNIERAIKKGFGEEGKELQEVIYEAYGPGGVAMILCGFTDNRNKSSAEVRSTLSKQGCALAEPGAALWAFEKMGDEWSAKTTIPLSSDEKEKVEKITDALMELESVDDVYTNAV